MKYETKEERFERKLKHGDDKWEPMPNNHQEGQACPFGCIMVKRIGGPDYYNLRGDCRAPSADDCCMNVQFDTEYYETRAKEKARWGEDPY
jgi:hypothetical protein